MMTWSATSVTVPQNMRSYEVKQFSAKSQKQIESDSSSKFNIGKYQTKTNACTTKARTSPNISSPTPPSSPKSHAEQVVAVSGKQLCSHCSEELSRLTIINAHIEFGISDNSSGTFAGFWSSHGDRVSGLYYHVQCFLDVCVCHSTLGNGVQGLLRVRVNKLHCRNCYSNDEAGLKFSKNDRHGQPPRSLSPQNTRSYEVKQFSAKSQNKLIQTLPAFFIIGNIKSKAMPPEPTKPGRNSHSNFSTRTSSNNSSPVSPSSLKSHAEHVVAVSGFRAAMVIESLGLNYHAQCFTYCVCHSILGNGVQGADLDLNLAKFDRKQHITMTTAFEYDKSYLYTIGHNQHRFIKMFLPRVSSSYRIIPVDK
ncbi:LMO7 [Mytilus coruscus]|uniref:LMO7 n=1 Tax=Mytilus coruscus TaxID=42192 RepID=A0A6J7ZU98_MYTCO|nr:LMO7 [Mytilus coruscus]